MEKPIDYHETYEFIDLVRIYQKADFTKGDGADIFVLKNKFRWSIENKEQEHYFKYFILKRINQLLLEKK